MLAEPADACGTRKCADVQMLVELADVQMCG